MKYIIDTDPGIDDAVAIMLGYLNGLDIIGFTLADGNIRLEHSINNIKVIEDFLESNIPIYKSSERNPFKNRTAEYAHGVRGLGYTVYPENKRVVEKKSAEDFIIKASKKYKDNLTIVCFGALTNLANAIRKDPKIVKRLKHIVIMGSSYDEELEELYKEFNFGVDPQSAKLVLETPFEDIKIVTHEFGIKALIDEEYVYSLEHSDKLTSQFLSSISRKYIDFGHIKYKVIGMVCPDPITMASIIDPTIIEFEPCKVQVYISEKKRGTCNIELVEDSNIKISYKLDLKKYTKLFKNTFN